MANAKPVAEVRIGAGYMLSVIEKRSFLSVRRDERQHLRPRRIHPSHHSDGVSW
jgi:hypothetical protein